MNQIKEVILCQYEKSFDKQPYLISQNYTQMLRVNLSRNYLRFHLKINYQFAVRVRFAPSPTGFMHIGGLRTALFNYLFARKHEGKFIVRIEDTDKNREVEGSLENIFETLNWLGINPDESIIAGGPYIPYIQSERLSIYKNIQKHLLKNNIAYPCFCPEHTNQSQIDNHQKHTYDRTCRKLTLDEIKDKIKNKQQYAVRLKSDIIKMPDFYHDQVFGDLEFKQLDDFVIVRKNGWPTFHLANVVDDLQMGITHVLRGQEWLSNTNKHIYLYRILGSIPPKFVHLPLIKAMNGKKLAKRDPTSSVKFIQNAQYQLDAVKSFLSQMGLNRCDPEISQDQKQRLNSQNSKSVQKNVKEKIKKQETDLKLLSQEQMINQFDLGKITRVPVKFDIKQLDFLNKLALKKRWKDASTNQKDMQYFISKVHQYISASQSYQREYIIKTIGSVVERLNIITEVAAYNYYFEEPNYLEQKSCQDFQKIFGKGCKLSIILHSNGQKDYHCLNQDFILKEKNKKIIHNIRIIFEHIILPEEYNDIEIAKRISQFLFQSPELKNEDVYHLLRYMITGRKSGPNINLACAIIGRNKILARIQPFSNL